MIQTEDEVNQLSVYQNRKCFCFVVDVVECYVQITGDLFATFVPTFSQSRNEHSDF